MSSNGLEWQRGHGDIKGARGEAKAQDVGRVLEPNEEDWWWLDTRHMAVSDVQVSSVGHCISQAEYLKYPDDKMKWLCWGSSTFSRYSQAAVRWQSWLLRQP